MIPADVTSLTNGSRVGTGAATTAVTASVTPTSASGALFITVTHAVTGGATITGVTGLGLTWSQVTTQPISTSTHVDVWSATFTGTPAAGAVTITFSVAAVSAVWDLIQADGADTTTPYVTTNTSTSTSGSAVTTSSLTFNQACAANNLLYFACGVNNTITQTPTESPTAWTELSDNSATGPGCSMETQVSPSSPGTGPASTTLSASGTTRAIGIEINAAAGGGPSSTPLTAYLTNTNDTLLTTARQLSATAPAAATTVNSGQYTKSGTGYSELYSQGGNATRATTEPTPSDHGFLFDVTTLEGQQIVAGTWSVTVTLSAVATGFTVTPIVRIWKRSSAGVYTQFTSGGVATDLVGAAGWALTTSAVTHTITGSLDAMSFAAGDKLYIDVLVNITTGSSNNTAANRVIVLTENGGANEAATTPGYATSSTPAALTPSAAATTAATSMVNAPADLAPTAAASSSAICTVTAPAWLGPPIPPNLVTDPSFEHDPVGTWPGNTPNTWVGAGSGFSPAADNALVTQDWAKVGTNSIIFDGSLAAGSPNWIGIQDAVLSPASPGQSYIAGAAVYVPSGVMDTNTFALVRIAFFDAAQVSLANFDSYCTVGYSGGHATIANGDWFVTGTDPGASGSPVAPANTAFVRVEVFAENWDTGAARNVNLRFDAIALYQASAWPGYYDGDSAGWVWTGVPGASTSQPAGVRAQAATVATCTVFVPGAAQITPSAACAGAATVGVVASALITPTAGASTAARVTPMPVFRRGAIVVPSSAGAVLTPSATATTSASATVTAVSAVTVNAIDSTQATAALAAPAGTVPSASSTTQASAVVTALAQLSPVARDASQATAQASANARLTPVATDTTAASTTVTAGARLAPIATDTTAASASVTAPALLSTAATDTTAATASVTVPAFAPSSAIGTTQAIGVVNAASDLLPSVTATTQATAAVQAGVPQLAPTAQATTTATVVMPAYVVPQAASTTQATAPVAAPARASTTSQASTSATAVVTARSFLAPQAGSMTVATASVSAPARLTPSAAGQTAATAPLAAPGLLSASASSTTSSTATVFAPSQLQPAASATSATSASAYAPSQLSSFVRGASQATLTVTALASVSPSATATSQAVALMTSGGVSLSMTASAVTQALVVMPAYVTPAAASSTAATATVLRAPLIVVARAMTSAAGLTTARSLLSTTSTASTAAISSVIVPPVIYPPLTLAMKGHAPAVTMKLATSAAVLQNAALGVTLKLETHSSTLQRRLAVATMQVHTPKAMLKTSTPGVTMKPNTTKVVLSG